MVFINIAGSHHGRCFICKRKTSLRKVSSESIYHAYKKHNILIKHHARCCVRHLDKNGLIKNDQFSFIPTYLMQKTKRIKIWLDNKKYLPNQSGIFDDFKNLTTLTEDHCYRITRWTRKEFIRFSKYITSINDTSGRTKEELIALYRYWLRKGIDQSSLAMFFCDKNQNQISHYLEQIRVAINKDFVPFFLGTSKQRDFFVNHNNSTTKILHGLKKKDLAIIVDSTYTRLEKSANNQFQYNCWSQQKMDLLIKPFLVCCPDGYIIDCYGPFQANWNDAKIFEYILETDKSLLSILIPHQTIIFLDRGKIFFNLTK
jgi:hypothetical protein